MCLQTVYDSGTVNITVNGVEIGVGYGRGSTAASIASALAGAINGDSSYAVTATASSGTVNLTSKATGTASNYSLSASYTYDSTDFSAPSFTPSPSGSTLTGGTNGTSGTNTFSMSTPYQTFYSYDALGNLQQVQQHGNDSNSAHWRTRSFIYDSLSRLTNSTNPEAGTVTYTYDNDGNVATKKDGRGITTTYGYDALNRILGMTYTNGDRSVTYSYDGSGCLGQSACYNIGSRTGMTDAGGSESWSYSIMGRMEADQRTTNSVTKITTYTYNADGSLLTLTYPTGRTVSYAYDNAGRPQSGIDQANSINYAEAATYAPQGALASMVLGQGGSFAGINLSESYTDRLQPNELKASSSAGTVIDLSYCFYALVSGACPTTATNDNGNVMAIFNNLNSGRTQTFAYDALNRIATAQTQGTTGSNCFGFQFTYDGWANLTATSILSGYTSCGATTPDAFGISVDGNNHLTTSGFTYDSSGNVLTDGVNTYAWNAESETKTAQGVTYTYDGLGNRVEKSNGTLYWFGPGGEVLDETNLTGSLTNEYVFFAGKRVARRDASGNIYYYAEDFIGSSRVITQSNGTLCSDADFLPFGQEVDFTSACGQNYKFEGKERDIETGNDNFGARYYRSALGRWMSPDWSAIPAPVPYANLTNPQTLNLYAMTSDNPEAFADLDGHTGGILEMIAEEGGFGPDIITGSDAYTDGTDTVISLDGSPPPVPILPTTPPQSPTGVAAQQQNDPTLNLGGTKVNVSLSAAEIDGGKGAVIDAYPQGCSDCRWTQTVTRTGNPTEATHTDREAGSGAQPLYPGGAPPNNFYDAPYSHGAGSFKAVTTLGIVNGKSFKVLGSMTWGYSLSKNGGVTLSGPRVATRAEQAHSIAVLRRDSPSWNIGP
ncbi:MAG: RHS repeat-associated core domain-containing protein [Candidatus Acidiferrales bacterium]